MTSRDAILAREAARKPVPKPAKTKDEKPPKADKPKDAPTEPEAA